MKSKLIKSIALTLSTLMSLSLVATSYASASVVSKSQTQVAAFSQGGVYNFREITLSDKYTYSNVYTKNDLPEKAKELYKSNSTEGDKVISIINHANYFAERFYDNDGNVRNNRDAYKNAYIGAALILYKIPFETWGGALFNSTSYEKSIDNGNAITGKGWYTQMLMSMSIDRSEATLCQFINNLVEEGKLYVSSPDGKYIPTSLKSKATTKNQQTIMNNNYSFGSAALNSYNKAFDLTKTQIGSGFNDRTDAFNKALYGALLYIDAKKSNTDYSTAKDWISGQYFYFEDSRTTAINFSYYNNALAGLDAASQKGISTEAEAIQIAKDLLTTGNLSIYNIDGGFSTLK